ncbi:MAG: hypothetical protein RLZZ20_2521, partial [Pseudomonadota bacterium]
RTADILGAVIASYLRWIGKTGDEFAGMPVYRTNAR